MTVDGIDKVAGIVTASDFVDPDCRAVFTAVTALAAAGMPPSYPVVATWLHDHESEAPADVAAVQSIYDGGRRGVASLLEAASIVRKKAAQRKVADMLASLASRAMKPDADVAVLAEQVRARLDELDAGSHTLPPRITSADCLHPEPIDFVLPGLPRGAPGMIVGQGAIGKSMFAFQLGGSVAVGAAVAPRGSGSGKSGELWPAQPRGAVAICFGEDRPLEVEHRGQAIYSQLTPEQVRIADGPDGLFVYSTTGLDMRVICAQGGGWVPGPFLPIVRRLAKGRRLLILDPLAFLHDAPENDNGAMTYLMRTLARVGDETNCAIVVLHHIGKPGKDERDEAFAPRGASALTTAVRAQYSIRKLTEAELAAAGIGPERADYWLRFAVTKANYIPPQDPGLLRRMANGLLSFAGKQKAAADAASGRKAKGEAKGAGYMGHEE
jgi:RecA-family ATPase